MAQGAPAGNQFWRMRSKHGRDKIFATPEAMWDAAVEYFEYNDANPRYDTDFRGKDATEVHIPKPQPLSMEGLCLFLGINTLYFRDFKVGLTGKKDEMSKDFSLIVTRIEETIFKQQYDGAVSGFFRENIIARRLGIADKVDQRSVNINLEASVDVSQLSEQALKELNEISDATENKRIGS